MQAWKRLQSRAGIAHIISEKAKDKKREIAF